jgi:hypothetical protein
MGWLARFMTPRHSYQANDWLFLMAAAGITVFAIAARLVLYGE